MLATIMAMSSLSNPGAAHAQANNAPTGAPAIVGTPQIGTLSTSNTLTIDDPDGLTGVAYAYQWIRVAGSETNITGATAPAYYPGDDDVGAKLKLKVDFTDEANNSESLTSAASSTVTPNGALRVPWSGTLTVAVSADGTGFIKTPSLGSLSPETFDIGAPTFTISKLAYDGSANISISLDKDIPREFTLLYGTDGKLHSADATNVSSTYSWAATDPGWSAGDKVSFALQLEPEPKTVWSTTNNAAIQSGVSGFSKTSSIGSLADAEFRHNNIDYEGTAIASSSGGLLLGITPFPPAGPVATWVLTADETDHALSAATAVNNSNSNPVGFMWADSTATWTDLEAAAVSITANHSPAMGTPVIQTGDQTTPITMTVGRAGIALGYRTPTTGSLSTPTFTIGSNAFTIRSFTWDGDPQGSLFLTLDNEIPHPFVLKAGVAVFFLQDPEPPHLRHPHSLEPVLSVVESLLADPHLAADLGHRGALRLAQDEGDLLRRIPGTPHGTILL